MDVSNKVLEEIIRKYINSFKCNETCLTNPISCAQERYAVNVMKNILEEAKRRSSK